MKAIFVGGTDTGIGKTVVCGLLARYLSEKGFNVITQKWVQTGCSGFSPDIKTHLKIAKKKISAIRDCRNLVCPYTFKLPASAHLASRREGRGIDSAKILKSFKLLSSRFDFVIVEGLGGALVPIDKRRLLIDLARELDLPVLIVAQNKLGAINQALMTVEVLRSRKMKILGIIFNNLKRENRLILEDNPKIVRAISKERVFGSLPWNKDYGCLYEKFIPLAKKIIRALR